MPAPLCSLRYAVTSKTLREMGLVELKRALKTVDKDGLINLVCDLYRHHKQVKDYLDFYVNPDEEALYARCREKVLRAFFPKRGYALRLAEGRKAIAEFRIFGGGNAMLADLMLCYAENGVAYTNEYGDISMSFYDSVSGVYRKALLLMRDEGLLDRFRKRARLLVDETDGIGWGFHSDMMDAFAECYGMPSKRSSR